MSERDAAITGPAVGRRASRSVLADQSVGGFFAAAMTVARKVWPSKTAQTLAMIFECDQRSAERYLAGRVADAETLAKLIVSDAGASVIKLYADRMPPERQAAFWKEMAKAARRAELLEERARLERELSQVSG